MYPLILILKRLVFRKEYQMFHDFLWFVCDLGILPQFPFLEEYNYAAFLVFEKKQFFFQTMFFIVEKKLFFFKVWFFSVFFFKFFLNAFNLLLKVV